jgi:hypothetical protein
MPRPPKYPLEPLLGHRERKVDDATVELGAAIAQREAAEAARLRAERARREAEERAAAIRADEAARLAKGELRAVDLARKEAWEVAVAAQMSDLTRDVAKAEREAASAHEGEASARAELARTKADRDVVAKDKGRFVDAQRRAAEAADEENAGEAWRGRR